VALAVPPRGANITLVWYCVMTKLAADGADQQPENKKDS